MQKTDRIMALDLARTAAILAMVVFHFSYDLMLFGYTSPGMIFYGFWPFLARATAASFLCLCGVSLWLAHGTQVHWGAFWRRFARIAGAAALVSLVSYFAMPSGFIRWGILHMIAAGSLIGVLALRLPFWALLALAGAAFFAPSVLEPLADSAQTAPIVSYVALVFGLLRPIPFMADYLPLLPWLCPVFLGIAFAKLCEMTQLWGALGTWKPQGFARALSWPGKHSLIIYLAHQPVLIALLTGFSMIFEAQ